MDCIVVYPDGLEKRAYAFDGTIERVEMGTYNEEGTPATLTLRLNEVFRGDLDERVVMHSWDFMLPQRDVTGVRILAAAGPTLDLMGCGFTRPYSREEADMWRTVFSGI